jgi:hypothetical protein
MALFLLLITIAIALGCAYRPANAGKQAGWPAGGSPAAALSPHKRRTHDRTGPPPLQPVIGKAVRTHQAALDARVSAALLPFQIMNRLGLMLRITDLSRMPSETG